MRKDNVHPIAALGFEQGADAYERGRPEYPQQAVDCLLEAMGVGEGSLVVDLAAGTGKFTRLLIKSQAAIIAVEPAAAMRKAFSSVLPDIEILPGSASAMPLTDNSASAITIAQAFHWFANHESLAEFQRVLKPGGYLGLIWNRRNEETNWAKKVGALVNAHNCGAPQYADGKWRQPLAKTKLFSPLNSKTFVYEHLGNKQVVLDRVASISFIAALEPKQRQRLLEEITLVLDQDPDTAGKPEFAIPYFTEIYWTQKL
jgi:SAM-dependent methyltransferase